MNSLISIIIPHFNSSDRIRKLLNSLMVKEKDNLEIIIVDDKSSITEIENLKGIVKQFSLNISLYENQTNKKGAGVCRNIGIQKATSPWILFADSDDHFTASFYKYIEPYLTADFDIVYFSPTSQDENGNVTTRHFSYSKPIEEYLETKDISKIKYKIQVVWSKLFRAEMIKKHNITFDSTLSSNDVMFSLKCDYYSTSFAVDSNTIYSWDFNSKSITSSMSKEKFSDILDVYIRKNNFFREKLSIKEYKNIRNSAIRLTGMALVRYRFGLLYSLGIFIKLLRNKHVLIKLSDIKISRLKNFLRNNQFYKQETD